MQEPGDRKNNYHMVRLLAVLAVLCGFMSPMIGHPDLRLGSQKLQDIGIQILFLTGGCLAAESWRRDADTLRFLARRFARIWPPFAVMVLNMCLIAGPLVSDLGVQGYFRSWWKNYLLNLRFYIIFSQPGVFAGNPIGQVTNAVLWTLPVGAFLSLVTPGVSSTILMRFPAILLKNVDLPTFGRPTTATMGFAMVYNSSELFVFSSSPLMARQNASPVFSTM